MVSILHREMRAASRRPWMFRVRMLTMVGTFFVGVALVATGAPGGGGYVFKVITFLGFWFCLLEGVRRAAGSIAEEKKDGTLGLLFLTPLKPRDIIGAKLFSVMIPVLQPLLAVAPILSICLLLGGVTGGEVFRAMIVLEVVLLFSISIGLMVSAMSRKTALTGGTTALLLILTVIAPQILANGFPEARFFSPWTAFRAISDPAFRIMPEDLWKTLLTITSASAAALATATFFLPRRWEEEKAGKERKGFWRRQRVEIPAKARAKYLDGNPGEWLAAKFAMGRMGKILLNSAVFGTVVFAGFLGYESKQSAVAFVPLLIAAFVMFLRIASQASYPLSEARRSGAIEMVLSTPLRPEAFIVGQKVSLLRQFSTSLGLLTVGAFLCPLIGARDFEVIILSLVFSTLLWVGAGAFGYVGMWMGLRQKSANSAFFYTVVLLIAGPVPFACVASLFAWPLAWVILWIIASENLKGPGIRRAAAKEPHRPNNQAPPRPLNRP